MFVISSYNNSPSQFKYEFSAHTSKMATMKAAVVHEAGGPEVLKLETLPIPTPNNDQVLIQIKAFGL
jgi:hypothetical protein